MRKFAVVLTRDAGDDAFAVFVPELPGCFSQVDTVEDALRMAQEAIELHLEGLAEDGDEIPSEPAMLVVTSVTIEDVPAPSKPRRHAKQR